MSYWTLIKTFGPFVLIALLLTTCAVQTKRLDHAKADLVEARLALKDPATGKPWKLVAENAAMNYATCQRNEKTLSDTLTASQFAVDAWKRDGERRDAEVAKARQAAQKSALAAQAAADRLQAFQAKGADVCTRLLEVDKEVRETTR